MSRVSKHSTGRWVAYRCFSEFRTLARLTLTACKSAKQQRLTKPVISRRHWVIHPSNSCTRIFPGLLLVRFSCTDLPNTHGKRKSSLSQFWLTFHKSVAGRSCCQTLFPSVVGFLTVLTRCYLSDFHRSVAGPSSCKSVHLNPHRPQFPPSTHCVPKILLPGWLPWHTKCELLQVQPCNPISLGQR